MQEVLERSEREVQRPERGLVGLAPRYQNLNPGKKRPHCCRVPSVLSLTSELDGSVDGSVHSSVDVLCVFQTGSGEC